MLSNVSDIKLGERLLRLDETSEVWSGRYGGEWRVWRNEGCCVQGAVVGQGKGDVLAGGCILSRDFATWRVAWEVLRGVGRG